MVLTRVVVIPHLGFGWWVNGCLGFDVDVFTGCTTLVFDVVGWASTATVFDVVGWAGTATVFTLSDVEFEFLTRRLGFTGMLACGFAFDVKLDVGVLFERCLIAISGEFYLREAFTFLVDSDLFLAARTVFLFVTTSGRQRG